jgi:hypothetical protein
VFTRAVTSGSAGYVFIVLLTFPSFVGNLLRNLSTRFMFEKGPPNSGKVFDKVHSAGALAYLTLESCDFGHA